MKQLARVILALALLAALTYAQQPNLDRKSRRGRDRAAESEGPDYDSPSRPSRAEMRKRKRAANRDEMLSPEFNKEVMADDSIQETLTPDDNQDGYLSDDEINKIWQEHMHDFVPEDMINAVVEKKTSEALFETISHVEPTTIKGAYYVYGGNKDKTVSCIVYDPNREVVYKRKGSAQGIIIFETTVPGEYSFIFNNNKAGEDLVVTLALHTFEQIAEPVKYDITESGQRFEVTEKTSDDVKTDIIGEENLAATEQEISIVRTMLREIHNDAKKLQNEAKMSLTRQKGHNKDLLENQSWNFYFMLVELAAFLGVLLFQTHHIKKSLDNKLIL